MLHGLWEAFLSLVFPLRRACRLCEVALPEGELCPQCRELLGAYRREPVCDCCGRYLLDRGVAASAGRAVEQLPAGLCPHCRAQPPCFNRARSVAPYEGVVRSAVHNFKYRNRRYLARTLVGLMLAVAADELAFRRHQLVLPVPISRQRLRHRGFNQAGELAHEVARGLQMEYSDTALVKVRETPPQTGLTRRERKTNLSGAFKLVRPDLIRGQEILIIDDVFTTGATIGAVCPVLRQAGAAQVTMLTFAGTRLNDRKLHSF